MLWPVLYVYVRAFPFVELSRKASYDKNCAALLKVPDGVMAASEEEEMDEIPFAEPCAAYNL
jgi:hypothetical protein